MQNILTLTILAGAIGVCSGLAGCDKRTTTPPNSPATAVKTASMAASAPVSAPTSPPASAPSTEATYKLAFGILDIKANPKTSQEDLAEIASDMGFYMMEAKDTLANSGIVFETIDETKYGKIPVMVNGKLLKYINGKALMKNGGCCGFVVIKNGKEPTFISLAPRETAKRIKAYFD